MSIFKEHITKEMIRIVDSSYENWLNICKDHPDNKKIMANQIGLCAQNYFEYGESFWVEKFKDVPEVMEELLKIKNQ